MSLNTVYSVKVVATADGNRYYINNDRQKILALSPGSTYRFDQSDSTNSGHPLRFSITSNGTHDAGAIYTSGVTTFGTPGASGAYTEITIASQTPNLFYFCTNHSYMGGRAETVTTSNFSQFNLDTVEVIEEAFERCGLEVRTGYDAKTARRSLNLMFAEWANRGINLWTVRLSSSVILTQGQATVNLPASAVDLLDVVLRRDGTDFLLNRISRSDYTTIPNKSTQGRPSQYYFDRQISPVINLWSVPNNSTDQLIFYYVERIQDVDSLTSNPDMPFRFYPCMVAGLAYYLAIKRAPERVQLLKSVYEEEFQRAADEDQDRVPLKLQPSIQYLRF